MREPKDLEESLSAFAPEYGIEELLRGFVIGWSCDNPESPPPRPLVRRAPRAGVQEPDQLFLVLAAVGDARLSGVSLGALLILHPHACAGYARRDVAGELRFRCNRYVDVASRDGLVSACI